ncbi:MAG: hypothetical protein ABS37_17605 [Acidovorax sp. SCN 65-108]|nr:MAG: hypothetical protein ABS37_17605 [Acidovorax sp. SCN 65-108]OJV74061.1 MAG: hypothetical protein BGO35_07040 [Burkholderiales bacterium 64-34]
MVAVSFIGVMATVGRHRPAVQRVQVMGVSRIVMAAMRHGGCYAGLFHRTEGGVPLPIAQR